MNTHEKEPLNMITEGEGHYIVKKLAQYNFNFNRAQKMYLTCLMMQFIREKQSKRELLKDIKWHELTPEYLSFLAVTFAPEVISHQELG